MSTASWADDSGKNWSVSARDANVPAVIVMSAHGDSREDPRRRLGTGVPAGEHEREREAAAGGIAADDDRARRRVVEQGVVRRDRVVHRGRERVLRREPVVERDDARAASGRAIAPVNAVQPAGAPMR